MAFDKQRTYFGGHMQSLGRLAADAVVEREGNHWRALTNGPQAQSSSLNVLAMEVFKGTLYAGGFFTRVGGMPAGGLACWDGHRWSVLGGTNGEVYILKADDHGVLAGGDFTLPGSTNHVTLARWDGREWDVLSGTGLPCAAIANCPLTVGDLEILGDDVLASVEWKDSSGFLNSALARFDKHRQWSALPNPRGSGSGYDYYSITKFRGQLVAGGEFSNPNNPLLHNIALWNGTAWQPLGEGLSGYVMDVAGRDHHLYALHEVPTNLRTRYIVSRWDGTRWSALGTNYFESPDSPFRLFVSPKDEVYVVGYFTGIQPIVAPNIVRWDGRQWEALFEGEYEGVAGDASAPLAFAQHQGELYMAGSFQSAGAVFSRSIARWDGRKWHDVGGSIQGSSQVVRRLASSGPLLFASGSFHNIGGVAVTNIASWNGVAWQPLGAGIQGSVSTLTWWQGSLYVSGFFQGIGGVAATNLARWEGTQWHPWSVISNGNVNALTVWRDQLYLGGSFTQAGPVNLSRMARWDGSQLHDVGGGVSGTGRVSVAKLAAGANGLYVAGIFMRADGQPVTNIARWDGTNWHSLGEGWPGSISALAVRDTTVFVGGRLTNKTSQIESLRRWDGRAWNSLGSGIQDPRYRNFGRVLALEATEDGLFAGGIFTWAGGKPSAGVARWVEHPRLRLMATRSGMGEPIKLEPDGDPGLNWRLETSSDLGNWVPLTPETSAAPRNVKISDPNSRSHFFRGVLVP